MKMVERINELIDDINLDFKNDIIPISFSKDGGSITERHILYALGKKIIEATKSRENLIAFISDKLEIQIIR